MAYALKGTINGKPVWLRDGPQTKRGPITRFASKRKAEEMRALVRQELSEDDRLEVVPYPTKGART